MINTPEILEPVSISQSQETIDPRTADVLSKLEAHASAVDQRTFASFVESIDWTKHSPQVVLRAIDLALRLELQSLAIDLAQKGSRLFPTDVQLQKAAQVLKTPVVKGTYTACDRGLQASRVWLREHANQYRGKWIAVHEGRLIGAADSLDILREKIVHHSHPETTLITRIL